MQDRAQLVRIFAQDNIEPATEPRGLHFAPMPFAYGRDFVGKKNPPFEEIEFPEKFNTAQGEEALG